MGTTDPPGAVYTRTQDLIATANATAPGAIALIRALPALAMMTNGDSVAAVSKRLADFVGADANQLLGHGWVRFVHPEDRPRSIGVATAVAFESTIEYSPFRNRYLSADGTWVLVEWQWNAPTTEWPWVVAVGTVVGDQPVQTVIKAVSKWRIATSASKWTSIGVALDEVLRLLLPG